MSHPVELTPFQGLVKAKRAALAGGTLLVTGVLSGCEGGTILLPAPPFGQLGQIQVEVRSLLPGEVKDGYLDEILIWASNGPWLLTERVSYEGNLGAEAMRASKLNLGSWLGSIVLSSSS